MPTKTSGRFSGEPTRTTRFTKTTTASTATKNTPNSEQSQHKGRGRNKRWGRDPQQPATNQVHRRRSSGRAREIDPKAEAARRAEHDEQVRRQLINERNRRRRYPWIPALAAIPFGLLAALAGRFFTWTIDLPGHLVVLALATVPVLVAIGVTLRERDWKWLPELAAAGLGAGALVVWVGLAGLSWLTVLLALVATVVGGTRWWKAHPVGPGVARLEAQQPEPAAPEADETTTAAATSVPSPETDPYCIAWDENNARGGKAIGSRLTNREEDEFTVTFDVELKRGAQTVNDLLSNRPALASGLGEDTERVLFKRAPRGSGAHMARLTIITKDPVAETRFYNGPRVQDGLIKDVARFIDGSGGIDITMWDDGGTVGTMVVGSTGSGKSGAANVLVCGALSTGVMNLLYADPKGNSSTALATRARVAIIGKENVLKLPLLVTAMLKARAELAAKLGADQIFPTKEIPGWMFLHDEYSLIANDPLAQRVWTETINIIRAYGIWGVALNQSQGQPQWGSDHARSAFASQVIAFRVNSKSGSDLVPGLHFDPNELPVDEKGRPVPGMAVHAHYDTPTRWDFLPSESNAERMAEKGEPAPPYTTTAAFDTFFQQPPLHYMDELAITMVLGPAINGRWQVGGPGATHQFPDMTVDQAKPATPAKPRGKWGQRGPSQPAADQLTPVQTEVLAIVRGGTSQSGEIVEAAKAARSSVYDALDALTGLGLISKTDRRGGYEPVKHDA